jgi:DNA-binding SARP family transcriptional activator
MDTPLAAGPWLCWRCLGGCTLEGPAGPIHLESAKTRALAAYLALSRRPVPRTRLIGLLWGNQPEASARRNLRHALWNLRRCLAVPGRPSPLLTSDDAVTLEPAACWSDVAAFEAAARRLTQDASDDPAPCQAAWALYNGDFFEDVYVSDAPGFEEWVLVERERLREWGWQVLNRLVEIHTRQGAYPAALEYARQLLALDPWRESAHRHMMRLLALTGRPEAVPAQYGACCRVLAEAFGAQPSVETQSLFECLAGGQLQG